MIYSCERCGKQCTDKGHHMFSQTKANIKKYGAYLIHHPDNIKHLCNNCHANLKKDDKLTEREFVKKIGILGYCTKKINCFISDFPFETKCEECRDYEFDRESFYSEMKKQCITEKTLIPGSYGFKEW